MKIQGVIQFLESDSVEVSKLQELIDALDIEEKLNLHGYLNFSQLEKIYEFSKVMELESSIQEHIYYKYYTTVQFSEEVFQNLLRDFGEKKYIALESVIVLFLKKDLLSRVQMDSLNEIYQFAYDDEIKKQVFLSKIRLKMKLKNNIISEFEIQKLYEYKAYDLLKEILENKQIDVNTINLFIKPKENEDNRKKKIMLYQLASKIKKESFL